MKKFVVAFFSFFLFGVVFAQSSLHIVPMVYDYVGEDVLPAGCESVVDVMYQGVMSGLQEIHFVLMYDGDKLLLNNIAKAPSTNQTRYHVEDNKLYYTQKFSSGQTLESKKLLSLFVQSQSGVSETVLPIVPSESFVITNNGEQSLLDMDDVVLKFASVPACDPDVVPPTVQLVSPHLTGAKVDSVISLRIEDRGSQVDRDSLQVKIDGVTYISGDASMHIYDHLVEIDPLLDLSYGTSVNVVVDVQDTATFPAPNKLHKTLRFMTTAQTPLCQSLGCPTSLGRQITKKECIQMQKMYLTTDDIGQRAMKKLFKDLHLSCPLDTIQEHRADILSKVAQQQSLVKAKKVGINLFSALGWLLFVITFGLKLRYKKAYKKVKKSKIG